MTEHNSFEWSALSDVPASINVAENSLHRPAVCHKAVGSASDGLSQLCERGEVGSTIKGVDGFGAFEPTDNQVGDWGRDDLHRNLDEIGGENDPKDHGGRLQPTESHHYEFGSVDRRTCLVEIRWHVLNSRKPGVFGFGALAAF